jgi:hypothetical protein
VKHPFKGVMLLPSGNWMAQIVFKGVHYSLGTFLTIEQAASAYDKKAIEFFGEFAKTNF